MQPTYDKTWDILDSSKLKLYMSCPRQYFYEYVLGWRPDRTSVHLVFGEAWHRAMEHCYDKGFSVETIMEADKIASDYYNEFFTQTQWAVLSPKIPPMIAPTLLQYMKRWELDTFKVHYTEIAGSVGIGGDRKLHFRLDAVVEDKYGYRLLEHKTAGKGGTTWENQWHMAMQLFTYTHVLYCMYDAKDIYGITVNGTVFYKAKDPAFIRVDVRKSPELMNAWIHNVNSVVDEIERDMDRMSHCTEDDSVFPAFQQRGHACTNYFGCAFSTMCRSWANPLRRIDDIPTGFKVERWNPAEREEDTKNVKHL